MFSFTTYLTFPSGSLKGIFDVFTILAQTKVLIPCLPAKPVPPAVSLSDSCLCMRHFHSVCCVPGHLGCPSSSLHSPTQIGQSCPCTSKIYPRLILFPISIAIVFPFLVPPFFSTYKPHPVAALFKVSLPPLAVRKRKHSKPHIRYLAASYSCPLIACLPLPAHCSDVTGLSSGPWYAQLSLV